MSNDKIQSLEQIKTDLLNLFNKHVSTLKNKSEIYINCPEENKLFNYYNLIAEMEYLISIREDIKRTKELINEEINKNLENLTEEDLDTLLRGVD